MADHRFSAFQTTLMECINDKESNDTIEGVIKSYFGADYPNLIISTEFIFNLFAHFIGESLVIEDNDKKSVKEDKLSQRCKLMVKFVFKYREYQLNLLELLCRIKVNLGLSDNVFDQILSILHTNGVLTEDASNHWFLCKSDFTQKQRVIGSCIAILAMSCEARFDQFLSQQSKHGLE